MAGESGARVANWTQPLRTSRPMAGTRSRMRCRACGVVSTTKRMRSGSWISTICHGRPGRRALAAPSITPTSAAILCGSLVPPPKPALSTWEKKYSRLMPGHDGDAARRERGRGLRDGGRGGGWGVIVGGVVGVEDRRAVQEQPAGPLLSAHDAQRVGRVPPLRADLGEVFRPPLHVLPRLGETERQRSGRE